MIENVSNGSLVVGGGEVDSFTFRFPYAPKINRDKNKEEYWNKRAGMNDPILAGISI
jgi:hypothetical protein